MSNMSIKTFLTVSEVLPVETSILIRGPHGIGKSQVVRQVAKHFNLPVVDRRLSQMTEGDMIGLPSTDGEVTRFNPPDWYKNACTKPICLFLDELNRATPEVMQAAFQIVLDRELNGWKLHPETRVYAAINHSAAYTVNEMDPALLDRFWTIDLEPTVEDWLARNPDASFDTTFSQRIPDATVYVREVTPDGRPTVVEAVFDAPLSDPRYVWTVAALGGFEPFAVPAVGASVTVSAL